MNGEASSVVVVGAGAFGTSAALELRKRGRRVLLVDPGPLPHPRAASTDLSKVIRMDYGHDEFYMALAEEAMRAWDRWNLEWPHSLFHQDGFVIMARERLRDGTFEGDSYRLLRKRGHEPERIGPEELASRFPAWGAEGYPDGYFNPRAGWAESGAAVAHMVRAARARGVEVLEGRRVRGLLERGSRVEGVVTDGGEPVLADHVVVAAGAWTPRLLPWLEAVMWPTAQPVLHFRVEEPARFQAPLFAAWAADISNTGWYGFPALDDGTLKVSNHGPGWRVDPDGSRQVPAGTEERFRAFLSGTFPEVAGAPLVGSHLCLYCDTFDSDLWIDADPEREGLVVAAGGSGHGFKFVPIIGTIVADAIEGKPNPWAHRFAWREAGELRTEPARHDPA